MISDLLIGKSGVEKSDIKATQIALLDHTGDYSDKNGYQVNIRSLVYIPKGVEVLAQVWKEGKQLSFGDGTIDIERFRIINPPVLVDDPMGMITRVSNSQTRTLREDPVEAIRQSLVLTAKISGKDGTNIIPGKVGSTTTTVFGTDGADGRMRRNQVGGESWATLIAGAGNDVSSAGPDAIIRILSIGTSNFWQLNSRYICVFNTSPIPDTDTITAATLTMTANGSKSDALGITPDVDVYVATPASDAGLVAADYSQTGSVSQTGSPVAYASLSGVDGGTNTWNFSTFINISKIGNSRFALKNSNYDNAGVTPAWSASKESRWDAYFVDTTGTTKDPVMVITSAPAAMGGALLRNFMGMGM